MICMLLNKDSLLKVGGVKDFLIVYPLGKDFPI